MKKLLYIVRHAKSSWADTSLLDFSRPLNARGERDAPYMGKILHQKNISPELIISSPAVRTSSTAIHIAKAIGYQQPITYIDGIYEADLGRLLHIIGGTASEINTLMLVGHNPALTDLRNYFLYEKIYNLPTCAITCIAFQAASWQDVTFCSAQSGELVFYEYPKMYFNDALD
jgi:phosphohistidine phosphatase